MAKATLQIFVNSNKFAEIALVVIGTLPRIMPLR